MLTLQQRGIQWGAADAAKNLSAPRQECRRREKDVKDFAKATDAHQLARELDNNFRSASSAGSNQPWEQLYLSKQMR
jgi:hypothetical protein